MRTAALLGCVLLLALPIGCNRNSDCERYADHMAGVMTQGLGGGDLESRAATVRDGALTACQNGRVTEAQIECVLNASQPQYVTECMTRSK